VKLKIQNLQGKVVGSLEVADRLFAVKANPALVHQVVVAHQANARQGTSNTKTRDEVSGGGKKPWAQKHTGRARQGSIRSPQWRHGGIVFGPHPRSYTQHTSKRMRRQALSVALSEKVRSEDLIVLENLTLDATKTREMAKVLGALKVADMPVLLVTDEAAAETLRTARNLAKVDTLPAYQLNTYDVLRHRKLVMTVDAVRRAEELWSGKLKRGISVPAADNAEADEAAD